MFGIGASAFALSVPAPVTVPVHPFAAAVTAAARTVSVVPLFSTIVVWGAPALTMRSRKQSPSAQPLAVGSVIVKDAVAFAPKFPSLERTMPWLAFPTFAIVILG